MAAVLDTIGFIGTVFGLVGFFLNNLPQAKPEGTSVQIKVGLNSGEDTQGDISKVFGWDINNRLIGDSGSGGFIDSAGVLELTIKQETPGIQADFVEVAAGDNDICISWVSVTMFDKSPGGAWTGDIGGNCGQNMYPGRQQAGNLKDGKGAYNPVCAWFGGDNKSQSFKFRTRAYGEKAQDTLDSNTQCGSTFFAPVRDAINDQPLKRDNRPRPQWMQDRVVVSNTSALTHSAEWLCAQPNGWGPDFIGSDGKFCDMETRKVTPLCSSETTSEGACFDLDHESKTVNKRSFLSKREIVVPHKTYKVVDDWRL